MKAKAKIFYNPIEGSAPFAIHWYPGPFGDAKEAKSGNGVYWTSPNGELLAVQFDDVAEAADNQTLVCTKDIKIELKVSKGKPTFKVIRSSKKAA